MLPSPFPISFLLSSLFHLDLGWFSSYGSPVLKSWKPQVSVCAMFFIQLDPEPLHQGDVSGLPDILRRLHLTLQDKLCSLFAPPLLLIPFM